MRYFDLVSLKEKIEQGILTSFIAPEYSKVFYDHADTPEKKLEAPPHIGSFPTVPLTGEDLLPLMDAFIKNPHVLKQLCLSGVSLQEAGCEKLIELINSCTNLQKLNLQTTKINRDQQLKIEQLCRSKGFSANLIFERTVVATIAAKPDCPLTSVPKDNPHSLGITITEGHGVAKHASEVERWLSTKPDGYAEYMLGVKYLVGIGVPKNDAEALRWYRVAAEKGHTEAQYRLGSTYVEGYGVAKNDAEAARWYKAAAEKGHTEAQCYLGMMHEEGKGVTKNEAEAMRWYQAAAKHDCAKAQKKLNKLSEVCIKEPVASPNSSP